jgi:hypothetical protein
VKIYRIDRDTRGWVSGRTDWLASSSADNKRDCTYDVVKLAHLKNQRKCQPYNVQQTRSCRGQILLVQPGSYFFDAERLFRFSRIYLSRLRTTFDTEITPVQRNFQLFNAILHIDNRRVALMKLYWEVLRLI